MVGPKECWVPEKNLVGKNFEVQKNFWSKIFLGLKNFDQKHLCSKNFGPKKLGSKKLWLRKMLDLQKIGS